MKRTWFGYLLAFASVGGVSGGIALLERFARLPGISVVYLLAVLGIAIRYGRGPAVFASLFAFASFDFLFVEPRYTFTISDPTEWISLTLFLITGLVTSQLASRERQRAREAEEREREAVVLYDIARALGSGDLGEAAKRVADRLRDELALDAIAIDLSSLTPAIRARSGESRALTAAAQQVLGEQPTGTGRWVRIVAAGRIQHNEHVSSVPIKSGDQQAGSITVVQPADAAAFTPEARRILASAAFQLGLAIERDALRREATEAEILRRTDDLKSALLNAVSHDLRTPLASIMAAAGSLRQRDVAWSDDDRYEFASDIENEAQRLGRIVDNLLDLSRIDGGTLRPEFAWHDLASLIEDVLARLDSITAGHRLIVDIGDLPPARIDAIEIDQVLSNLIENAAKYAPGAEIRIAARLVDDHIEVEVADRGPGIPEEALGRVFEPFYRAERPGPRPRGAGVGLAVARGLIEAHHGTIRAENDPAGGARFVISLPAVREIAIVP